MLRFGCRPGKQPRKPERQFNNVIYPEFMQDLQKAVAINPWIWQSGRDKQPQSTMTTTTALVQDLAQKYRDADAAYQMAYAAFLSGSMTAAEMKVKERAKAKAFREYAKGKKAKFNF